MEWRRALILSSNLFLPVLSPMDCRVNAELENYGFHISGDGAWLVRIHTASEVAPPMLVECSEAVRQDGNNHTIADSRACH